MKLLQLFIPLNDNSGNPYPPGHFSVLRKELLEKFGGVTIFRRQPVEGFWEQDDGNKVLKDDLIVYEVIADGIDDMYWKGLKARLEKILRQKELLIRYSDIDIFS